LRSFVPSRHLPLAMVSVLIQNTVGAALVSALVSFFLMGLICTFGRCRAASSPSVVADADSRAPAVVSYFKKCEFAQYQTFLRPLSVRTLAFTVPNDRWYLKCVVALSLVLSAADTAVCFSLVGFRHPGPTLTCCDRQVDGELAYRWCVTNFTNPAILEILPKCVDLRSPPRPAEMSSDGEQC
jgi:hypothetical protein